MLTIILLLFLTLYNRFQRQHFNFVELEVPVKNSVIDICIFFCQRSNWIKQWRMLELALELSLAKFGDVSALTFVELENYVL